MDGDLPCSSFLLIQIILHKMFFHIYSFGNTCTYWQDKLLQVELPLKYCQIALLNVLPIQTLSDKLAITYYNTPLPT